jgi:hypothetical protein
VPEKLSKNSFLLFVAAAGKWGIALMTGGIASYLVALFEHTKGQSLPALVWAFVGIALFMVGAYLAWNDEHQKYQTEKAKHDNPNFILDVEAILTAHNQVLNITTLCFAATLINRGSPSHAGGWIVRYQSPTVDITVKYVSLTEEKALFPVVGGHNLILKRSDLLPARTLAAIERGHTRQGRLLFELPGDRRDEIHSGAAQMWVACFDNTGRICECLFKTGIAQKISVLRTYPDEEISKAVNALEI